MRLGDKTQFFQPLGREIKNRRSYFSYSFRSLSTGRKAAAVIHALMYVASFYLLGREIIETYDLIFTPTRESLALHIVSITVGTILPLVFFLVDWVRHLDDKHLYVAKISGVYDDVAPPGPDWKRRVINIETEGRVTDRATIFYSDKTDAWLRSGQAHVAMERDRSYEKGLKRKIQKNFTGLYRPFLRNNYRSSLFYGRQFSNESKWGISEELRPGCKSIRVHRSCYFDTYLTNIIPGSRIASNRTNEDVAVIDGALLPYEPGEGGRPGRLLEIGEEHTANELGVTTLCILRNGSVPLWRQNRQAQSSRGQLVATGSGSADWADCEKYLKTTHDLASAVIEGMERELYEESVGERSVSKEEFMKATDTRITGYFRWLEKGGKSEFVGVSRLRMSGMREFISAELSEVAEGDTVGAGSLYELKGALEGLVYPKNPEDPDCEEYISRECSISCSAAVLALQSLCREYCAGCESCAACPGEGCRVRPYDVLF